MNRETFCPLSIGLSIHSSILWAILVLGTRFKIDIGGLIWGYGSIFIIMGIAMIETLKRYSDEVISNIQARTHSQKDLYEAGEKKGTKARNRRSSELFTKSKARHGKRLSLSPLSREMRCRLTGSSAAWNSSSKGYWVCSIYLIISRTYSTYS